MVEEPDYYALLQVKPTATAEELRQQHRKLVRALHPDQHAGDPVFAERLTQINSAFHVLRDETRRSAYDRRIREAAAKKASPPHRVITNKATRPPAPFRPIDARYTTKAALYASHPAAKKTRRRNALIGGTVITFLLLALIGVVMTLSNENTQQSLNDIYDGSVNLFVVRTPAEKAAELKLQYVEIKNAYENRLSDMQSQLQNTITATQDDATSLENVGDAQGAKTLNHDAWLLQTQYSAIGAQVRTLDQQRSFADEAKLESSLDQSLDSLTTSNEELSREAQEMRKDSTDMNSVAEPAQTYNDPLAAQTDSGQSKSGANTGEIQ